MKRLRRSQRRIGRGGLSLLAMLGLFAGGAAAATQSHESSVGMPARIVQQVLPGTELVPRPLGTDSEVVLRIIEVFPHGSDQRYTFEYYGLEPGDYDLRDWLVRKDGSSTEDLPAMPVTIHSVLPPGAVKPSRLPVGELPELGGYQWTLIGISVLWMFGLVVLIYWRRGQAIAARGVAARPPPTLAQRLRPLVEGAIAGKLSSQQRSTLEMSLLAYWRQRLQLDDLTAADVLARVKAHPDAGPLWLGLEDWLHRPNPPQDVDVAALLRPYENVADLVGPLDSPEAVRAV